MVKTEKPQAQKKPLRKKPTKKAEPAERLPDVGPEQPLQALPRGQERLADGTIRLKTGAHDLGETPTVYDIHGARIELSGKVLIASQNVDWISVGKCQKCSTKRDGIIVRKCANGMTAVMFRCHNERSCDLGGRLYVQLHTPGRFVFQE